MADEVERLFQHLVQVLADRDPRQLSTPFQISELYQSIVPYRTHRVALQFDTNQDYEMAVLRLLAGEHGFATISPSEVQEAMRQEAGSPNPDTSAFRDFAAATVTLSTEAVRRVLDPQQGYRPPAAPVASPAGRADVGLIPVPAQGAAVFLVEQPAGPAPGESEAQKCPHCAGELPRRTAIYCPRCGGQVRTDECARCAARVEPGWRHCVVCGHRVAGSLP